MATKIIENEYVLIGRIQIALEEFIKEHGEFEPDTSDNVLKHTGTYTVKMLDYAPPVRFLALYIVALIMEEYENGCRGITLVLDNSLSNYTVFSGGRGIGCIRKTFSCYDISDQIALAQQILGAYALHEMINY